MMPVSPVYKGCEAGLCFCFSETTFLADAENCKVLEQSTAPKRLQDSERNRVPRSPTETPTTIDPVEVGYSLGRGTRDVGQPGQYGSSLGVEFRTPIGPTKYQGISLRGPRESQRSTTALATEATPSSSLWYTTPAGTVEGVERVLFPTENLTPPVWKRRSVEKKTSMLPTLATLATT